MWTNVAGYFLDVDTPMTLWFFSIADPFSTNLRNDG